MLYDDIAEDPFYAYHLSNCKFHNAVFTKHVINDLLKQYPGYAELPVLRFKSDNCASQYCCQYIFPTYAELAEKIGKPVLVYYGMNGHGKDLDAMSGFGVKTILPRAIVTDDFYYNTDEELCTFLKTQKSLPKYYYTTLPSDILDKEMVNYRESSLVIPGCLKCRMISFSPTGDYQVKRHICSCDMCCLRSVPCLQMLQVLMKLICAVCEVFPVYKCYKY